MLSGDSLLDVADASSWPCCCQLLLCPPSPELESNIAGFESLNAMVLPHQSSCAAPAYGQNLISCPHQHPTRTS